MQQTCSLSIHLFAFAALRVFLFRTCSCPSSRTPKQEYITWNFKFRLIINSVSYLLLLKHFHEYLHAYAHIHTVVHGNFTPNVAYFNTLQSPSIPKVLSGCYRNSGVRSWKLLKPNMRMAPRFREITTINSFTCVSRPRT